MNREWIGGLKSEDVAFPYVAGLVAPTYIPFNVLTLSHTRTMS